MMAKRWLILLLAALPLVSCKTDEKSLAAYWRDHDFSSLSVFDDLEDAQEQFDGWIVLLEAVPQDLAEASIRNFLSDASAEPVAYTIWVGWLEDALHAVSSPLRNDALFSVVLERVVADKIIDPNLLPRYQQMLQVEDNVCPGAVFPDVGLVDVGGRSADFAGNASVLLLLDSNCPTCTAMIDSLACDKRYVGMDKELVLLNAGPSVARSFQQMAGDAFKILWCPGREVEQGKVIDLTMIPSKVTLDATGKVIKSYHL